MTENPVHLTLTGRLSYEDDISVGEATQIVAFIDALHSGNDPNASIHTPKPQTPPITAKSPEGHRTATSPREALTISEARTNPEKIVALAAYLIQDSGSETFTIDLIRPLFQSARETIPARLNRDLDSAISSGWIAESGTKGDLYLTAKVANILSEGFAQIRSKRSTPSGKTRSSGVKKTRKQTTPDAFKEIDIFAHPILDAPPYGTLKLKRDKLLWTARLAKELNMEGLANKEIVWLTDKLGDGIASNDINGHFRGLQKLGYVNRSTIHHAIRITDSGEEYLKSLMTNE
ncbi:hypothetical protein [Amycolatopsis sp. NPDC004079]|uniref:hypothetical protein n=1 Tax=Amycolatopsis sp. NPDC004079 TaxID=3154549 RepID=UPI0033BB6310